MPDRFLEADVMAVEEHLAVDPDEELLDMHVDVRLQKVQELEDAKEERRQIKFVLAMISHMTCVERFRTLKEDILVLRRKLLFPDEVELGRVSWNGVDGLCSLARLTVPNRRNDPGEFVLHQDYNNWVVRDGWVCASTKTCPERSCGSTGVSIMFSHVANEYWVLGTK